MISNELKEQIEEWLEEHSMPGSIATALEDMGFDFDSLEDAIEYIDNSGEIDIVHADSSEADLGMAVVDMYGFPQNQERYIDEDLLQNDLEIENPQEDDQDDDEYRDFITELLNDMLDNLDSSSLDTYFDYDSFGNDLVMGDNYTFYPDDNVWIAFK